MTPDSVVANITRVQCRVDDRDMTEDRAARILAQVLLEGASFSLITATYDTRTFRFSKENARTFLIMRDITCTFMVAFTDFTSMIQFVESLNYSTDTPLKDATGLYLWMIGRNPDYAQ